jgi:DNA-binding protein HU-beta
VSVNKQELIDRLAERLGTTKKDAGEALDAVIKEIEGAVAAGEKVALTGFGVFEKTDRAARIGRNPRTGEEVKIKATSLPKFRPGADFKAIVAGGKKTAKKK